MTDTDSFIQEVTEEVRQDRMFGLWKRYGAYVLAGVFLIVAGAAFWQWRVHEQRTAAQEAGGALSNAAQVEDPAARADAFAGIEAGIGDAALLARFGEAAAAADAGDADRALAIYTQIAGDAKLPRRWGDLGGLKAAALQLDRGQTGAALALAQPLAAEDAPYRLLAVEIQGVAHALSGDVEAAKTAFETILNDPAATTSMKGRSAEFLRSIGVEPS